MSVLRSARRESFTALRLTRLGAQKIAIASVTAGGDVYVWSPGDAFGDLYGCKAVRLRIDAIRKKLR